MTIDQFGLRDRGYTGRLDQDGYVEHGRVEIPLNQKAAVTRAMVDLLTDVKLGGGRAPKFYVAKFEGSRIGPVKYRATKEALDQTLLMDGIVEGGAVIPIRGSVNAAAGSRLRYEWAPVPRVDVLTQLPTVDVVAEWPDFYIAGPGRELASVMPCPHTYRLTDSCPNCDADQENSDATPETAITVASMDLVPQEGLQRATEKGRRDAEQATPEQRRALLDLVAQNVPQEDPLRAAIRLAYETAQQDVTEIRSAFATDVDKLGAVRATRLWTRKAMRAETAADVWRVAVAHGTADGDWWAALDVSERLAVRLLRESVHPTRNAVDKALNEVQGRAAADLLDTIESFRKAAQR